MIEWKHFQYESRSTDERCLVYFMDGVGWLASHDHDTCLPNHVHETREEAIKAVEEYLGGKS